MKLRNVCWFVAAGAMLTAGSACAAESTVEWDIPRTIKIGYTFFETPGETSGVPVALVKNLSGDTVGDFLLLDGDDEEWEAYFSLPHAYDAAREIENVREASVPSVFNCAVNPGKFTFQAVLMEQENGDWTEQKIGKPYTVTIEKPVIKTNAPSKAEVGQSFQLKAKLQNTALKEMRVAEVKRYESQANKPAYADEQTHTIAYEPEFEITKGKNLVKRSRGNFSRTLSASETLKFTGAGTVEIKIRFRPVMPCYFCNMRNAGGEGKISQYYTPEKTVRIQVREKQKKVSSVKLNRTSLKLQKGESYRLKAAVSPKNASDRSVSWKSSNPEIAAVKNGKVTAKKPGTAVITAKAKDGSGKTAKCRVTVGYTIRYKLNGGKNSGRNPDTYYKETITLKKPARKGYVFQGWYRDKGYKKRIARISKNTSGNLTLYARWKKSAAK